MQAVREGKAATKIQGQVRKKHATTKVQAVRESNTATTTQGHVRKTHAKSEADVAHEAKTAMRAADDQARTRSDAHTHPVTPVGSKWLATADYDFDGGDDTELSIKEGDTIEVVKVDGEETDEHEATGTDRCCSATANRCHRRLF